MATLISMSDHPESVKTAAPRELSQDPTRLIRRRFEAGMTLRQAAAKAGCSYSHLSELERGAHSARVTTLVTLAGTYGCKVADLMPVAA
jgi:transcriptional regulator with XRE-family HTH domain